MINILEPLKVAARDTAAIHEHIWCANDAALDQDLFGCECGRSVGTLENSFTLQLTRITNIYALVGGCWHQVIYFGFHVGERIRRLNLIAILVPNK